MALILTLNNVTKLPALLDYATSQSALCTGFTSIGNAYTFYFTRTLTTNESNDFTTVMNAYTDPAYFYTWTYSENCLMYNNQGTINSSSVTTLYSLVMSSPTSTGAVLNSIKLGIKYRTESLLLWNLFNILSTNTLTLSIFNVITNSQIYSSVINMNDVLSEWKAAANSGNIGARDTYRITSVSGFHSVIPTGDSLLQLRLAVTNSSVYVTLQGLQLQYYNFI